MPRNFPCIVPDPFSPLKGLLRMSWSRYNLYNLARKRLPDLSRKSVFQQRWLAKRETRAYHVPNIIQRQFLDRHFKIELPVQKLTRKEQERVPPIQALTFAELERRLDVVIFRSHFARSIWGARRAVVTGKVLVNGIRCKYPGWRLKDGDLITVDPKVIPTLSYPETPGDPMVFKPNRWMTPWMFTPAYLEVDYNTCSTVFLRSPLPQPDAVEIPSPFPPSWHQLVHDWYADIRKKKKTIRVRKPLLMNGRLVKLKPKFDRMMRRQLENRKDSTNAFQVSVA